MPDTDARHGGDSEIQREDGYFVFTGVLNLGPK